MTTTIRPVRSRWLADPDAGRPGSHLGDPPRVENLLDRLRSASPAERLAAGWVLGRMLGAQLRAEGRAPEVFDEVILPRLAELLGLAMAGDIDAADELARIVGPGNADRGPPGGGGDFLLQLFAPATPRHSTHFCIDKIRIR